MSILVILAHTEPHLNSSFYSILVLSFWSNDFMDSDDLPLIRSLCQHLSANIFERAPSKTISGHEEYQNLHLWWNCWFCFKASVCCLNFSNPTLELQVSIWNLGAIQSVVLSVTVDRYSGDMILTLTGTCRDRMIRRPLLIWWSRWYTLRSVIRYRLKEL